MDVKQIDFRDTYPIRHKMLRPGRPLKTCQFKGDDNDLTFHLGAYIRRRASECGEFLF